MLLQYVTDIEAIDQALWYSIIGDNVTAFKVLSEARRSNKSELEEFYVQATQYRSESILLLLFDMGVQSRLLRDADFLTSSVKNNYKKIVARMLQFSLRSNNSLLDLAAAASTEMFQLVLSDQRIKPLASIVRIIKASRHAVDKHTDDNNLFKSIADNPSLSVTSLNTSMGRRVVSVIDPTLLELEQVASILAKDDRIQVEQLNTAQLRILAWALQGYTYPIVQAMIGASKLIDRSLEARSIGQVLDGSSSSSMLLRYILFKRPSSKIALLDWIIAARRHVYAAAADRMLEAINLSNSKQLVPIEGLFLSLLYPKMSLEDVIYKLRQTGARDKDIERALWLVVGFKTIA